MSVEQNINPFMQRVSMGIINEEPLINGLVHLVPEVCRPTFTSEISGKPMIGCLKMTAIIGKTALEVDTGLYSPEEALRVTKKLNTCDKCPLKTFE